MIDKGERKKLHGSLNLQMCFEIGCLLNILLNESVIF